MILKAPSPAPTPARFVYRRTSGLSKSGIKMKIRSRNGIKSRMKSKSRISVAVSLQRRRQIAAAEDDGSHDVTYEAGGEERRVVLDEQLPRVLEVRHHPLRLERPKNR